MYALYLTLRQYDRCKIPEDDHAWIITSDQGGSAIRAHWGVPLEVMIFSTKKEATKFITQWQPHPFWCILKSWEIVKLLPKYEKILRGYICPSKTSSPNMATV